MTTGAKRLAWYVTITLVMGGATVFAALALGLVVAWIEHPPAVTSRIVCVCCRRHGGYGVTYEGRSV